MHFITPENLIYQDILRVYQIRFQYQDRVVNQRDVQCTIRTPPQNTPSINQKPERRTCTNFMNGSHVKSMLKISHVNDLTFLTN